MASEVLIIGLSTGPIWGCPDLSWGKGQSFDRTIEGEKQALADGNGNTVAVAYYDNRKTVSYTIKISGAVPADMERGTVLQVDGENYVIESVKEGRTNTDFAEYTLELMSYENITLTA